MNSFSQLSEHEFERLLTPETLKTFQVIQGALMAGATMFLFIVILLYKQVPATENPDRELLNILSIVNCLFAIGAFTTSGIVLKNMFSENNLNTSFQLTATPYESCLSLIRAAVIVRMAILEGAVFFGFVVSMNAVTEGAAQDEPLYLLNMLPYLVFVVIGINTFPTKDRLLDFFRTYILKRM